MPASRRGRSSRCRNSSSPTCGPAAAWASPADLNGYPGPAHVLELADQLGLSTERKARVGELFAGHRATPASVAAATAEIGETQAKLRAAHLRYHLSTLEVLQPPQVQRYAELRGYGAATTPHEHHH
jgi:hypothetical protein